MNQRCSSIKQDQGDTTGLKYLGDKSQDKILEMPTYHLSHVHNFVTSKRFEKDAVPI